MTIARSHGLPVNPINPLRLDSLVKWRVYGGQTYTYPAKEKQQSREMIPRIVYTRDERLSISSRLPTASLSRARHASHESRSSAISIFVLSAISVAVRSEGDIVLECGLHAGYGRGRYILEDCFLSSGSHICHAKSLEEA